MCTTHPEILVPFPKDPLSLNILHPADNSITIPYKDCCSLYLLDIGPMSIAGDVIDI